MKVEIFTDNVIYIQRKINRWLSQGPIRQIYYVLQSVVAVPSPPDGLCPSIATITIFYDDIDNVSDL